MKKTKAYAKLSSLLLFFASLYAEENPSFLLSLQEAEMMAIENNKTIKATQQLLEKAKEGKLESYSKWLPELIALTQTNIGQKKQILVGLNSKHSFMTQLQLTQSIFSSKVYYDIQLAKLYVEQLELLLQSAINDVLFQLRNGYYQVLLDQRNVSTAKEHITLLTQLALKMKNSYDIGTSILYNVNQSQVAVANATTTYYQALKTLKVDKDQLIEILGFEPGSIEVTLKESFFPVEEISELSSKIEKLSQIFRPAEQDFSYLYQEGFPETQAKRMHGLFSYSEISEWEKIAEENRPDLKVSANNLAIANEVVKSRYGEYMPDVSFHGSYGGEPTEYLFHPSAHFDNQKFYWGLGLYMSWKLFDGMGRERRIKGAKHERRSKMFEYERSLFTAYREVRKQIYSLEEAFASYATAKGNVFLARETLLLASDQLDIGYISIFDYQISVDGLVQAMYTEDRANFDLISSYYGLRFASGIDVKTYYKE